MNKPPFTITHEILTLSMAIAERLGALEALQLHKPQIQLRRENTLKNINSSLAIEGNSLSLEQMTNILNNIPVVGPTKDILEVQNAIKVYDSLHQYSYKSEKSFLSAHRVLMKGLVTDAGIYRKKNVGVFAGTKVSHMAPPAKQVSRLMHALFLFLKKNLEISNLIKACVFHYELEFIHPFSDGNGRMGRLWQQIILIDYHPVFEYLPTESLIKEHQADYYAVLNQCDSLGESTKFIEFNLRMIKHALDQYLKDISYQPKTKEDRLDYAKSHFNKEWFTRQDYLHLHKTIATATASRDLNFATKSGFLESKGKKNQTKYRF